LVEEAILVGLTTLLPGSPPTVARVHFLCTEEGLLTHFATEDKAVATTGTCWAMPRLTLDETLCDGYGSQRSESCTNANDRGKRFVPHCLNMEDS
jgi:hypothetical protein